VQRKRSHHALTEHQRASETSLHHQYPAECKQVQELLKFPGKSIELNEYNNITQVEASSGGIIYYIIKTTNNRWSRLIDSMSRFFSG
jgi:hypothetical protein